MKTLLSITALALALTLTACSDDSKAPATVDQKITAIETSVKKEAGAGSEAGAKTEASVAKEAGASKDMPAGPWNCTLLGDCEKPCGTDMVCIDKCKAKACQAAVDAMQKVWDCVLKNCVLNCVKGWDSTCDACVQKSCKTDQDACYAQKC